MPLHLDHNLPENPATKRAPKCYPRPMPNPPASPRLILRLTAACLLAPCLTLCAASLALSAQTPPPAKRSISLDDLARIARVGSPVLSPDGAWVLYTVSRIDAKEDKSHSELWRVRWDGSSPTQLTYGKDGVNHPAFSPDGKYISFLSSRPGKAKGQQVWVLNRLGGEADQFTAVTDQDLNDFAWSPDSKTLLLTLEPKSEPDAEEGKPPAPPKPILIDRYHFKQDIQGYLRNDQREALYLLNLATKKVEKLTTDKLVDELNPVWSPDGQSIAYETRTAAVEAAVNAAQGALRGSQEVSIHVEPAPGKKNASSQLPSSHDERGR